MVINTQATSYNSELHCPKFKHCNPAILFTMPINEAAPCLKYKQSNYVNFGDLSDYRHLAIVRSV